MVQTLTMPGADVHAADKVKTSARWELRCGGEVDSRMVPGTSKDPQVTCPRCRELLGLPVLGAAARPPLGFNVK